MKNTIYLTLLIALVGVLMVSCEKETENKNIENNNSEVLINKMQQSTPIGPYRKFTGTDCINEEVDCAPKDAVVIDTLPIRCVKDFFKRNIEQLIKNNIDAKVVYGIIDGKYSAEIDYHNTRENIYYIRVMEIDFVYPIKVIM